MKWRSFVGAAIVAFACGDADAQVDGGSDAERLPYVNVGLGRAFLSMEAMEDARSGSSWEFRTASQYRATIDRHLSTNTTLGLTLAYSPLSLLYKRTGFDGEGPVGCGTGCRAEADYWSLSGSIRFVSGPGLHHIGELNLGVSQYSNFREITTRQRLAPLSADRDIVLTGGYGFGWSAGRFFQIELIGDVGFALHEESGTDFPRSDITWIGMARIVVRSGI